MPYARFFHPRNIYINRPDFSELATKYPIMKKHLKLDLRRRLSINFKDAEALRDLTKTLLLKDFGLDVVIDETKLIPVVPVRLNYILWIEDLLNAADLSGDVKGVDIGTGSSCIYSLLAAKKGWKMLGTDIDSESIKLALENITRNELSDLISVKLVDDPNKILVNVIDNDDSFDFCMCNPPFFSSTDEDIGQDSANDIPKDRTGNRPPPNNAASGVSHELLAKGGELDFICKLIRDSVVLGSKIKIYTVKIGIKKDFVMLRQQVMKLKPKSFVTARFIAGRTTRWYIAWTFTDGIDLKKSKDNMSPPAKARKKPPMTQFICQIKTGNELLIALDELKRLLTELEIDFIEQKTTSEVHYALRTKAYEDTWTHQRRRKREKLRKKEEEKKQKALAAGDEEPCEKKIKLELTESDMKIETTSESENNAVDTDIDEEAEERLENVTGPLNWTPKPGKRVILLETLMVLKEVEKSVILEISCLSGTLGRNGIYQLLSYFKNNWNFEIDY